MIRQGTGEEREAGGFYKKTKQWLDIDLETL